MPQINKVAHSQAFLLKLVAQNSRRSQIWAVKTLLQSFILLSRLVWMYCERFWLRRTSNLLCISNIFLRESMKRYSPPHELICLGLKRSWISKHCLNSYKVEIAYFLTMFFKVSCCPLLATLSTTLPIAPTKAFKGFMLCLMKVLELLSILRPRLLSWTPCPCIQHCFRVSEAGVQLTEWD